VLDWIIPAMLGSGREKRQRLRMGNKPKDEWASTPVHLFGNWGEAPIEVRVPTIANMH
jgi:hypothetical protein